MENYLAFFLNLPAKHAHTGLTCLGKSNKGMKTLIEHTFDPIFCVV